MKLNCENWYSCESQRYDTFEHYVIHSNRMHIKVYNLKTNGRVHETENRQLHSKTNSWEFVGSSSKCEIEIMDNFIWNLFIWCSLLSVVLFFIKHENVPQMPFVGHLINWYVHSRTVFTYFPTNLAEDEKFFVFEPFCCTIMCGWIFATTNQSWIFSVWHKCVHK